VPVSAARTAATRPAHPGDNGAVSADHYFSANPQAPARSTEVVFDAAGRTFSLTGAAGVFSANRLDPGTAVLLRKAVLPASGTRSALLDLGCGYGPITCVLATVAPAATVYAVDVNTRALDLVRANARALELDARVVAVLPDEVPPELTFAEIWSNPPIRVGKEELHAILNQWLPRLDRDGTAWLVAARHLGGDSLAQWLQRGGWQVRRHASQQGFRVLQVTHAEKSRDADASDEGHS
jgi:16S rRNA (guanine1207-N2)-methyltransferase